MSKIQRSEAKSKSTKSPPEPAPQAPKPNGAAPSPKATTLADELRDALGITDVLGANLAESTPGELLAHSLAMDLTELEHDALQAASDEILIIQSALRDRDVCDISMDRHLYAFSRRLEIAAEVSRRIAAARRDGVKS